MAVEGWTSFFPYSSKTLKPHTSIISFRHHWVLPISCLLKTENFLLIICSRFKFSCTVKFSSVSFKLQNEMAKWKTGVLLWKGRRLGIPPECGFLGACPVDSSLIRGEPLQGHRDLGLYGASQLGDLDQLRCFDVRELPPEFEPLSIRNKTQLQPLGKRSANLAYKEAKIKECVKLKNTDNI